MDQEPSNNKSKYIEFIFFLDCINNLEASLNFPINFNVYFEFHGNLLSVGDVIITLMDTDGKIDLEVSLSFPLDEIVEYKFASHPMLIYFESLNEVEQISLKSTSNNKNDIKQTWVCIVDLLPLVYGDTSDEVETSVKVCGQYPLKAIGERNQNLLSDAAYLNAALSCPTRLNRIGLTTPNNVLNIAMHGLYNPSLSGRRRQSRGSDTTCSAILHVPSAIDSVRGIQWHSGKFGKNSQTKKRTVQRTQIRMESMEPISHERNIIICITRIYFQSRTTVLDASDNEGVSTQMSTEWTFPFVVVDISVNYSLYDQYLKYLTSRQIALMQMNIISESPQAVICNRPKLNKYQDILKTIIEMLINNLERINDQYSVDVERYVQELRISETYESMYSLLFGEIQLYIRENYESPMIGETIQSFVNRIFTDLVNKMKKAVESFEFPQSGSVDSIQFERVIVYAREADEMEQAERAKIFYFDLNSTAGARCNPNYWLLYASLCSRRLDFDTALEYVKEVLLVDSGNRIGLFLYAAIQLIIHEDNNNGEIVLKSLIMSHGDFSEVYALLSVHYSRLNMYESSYIMLQRAERCVKVDTFENNSLICENLLSWTPISHENDPLIKCTILLLELELVQLAKYCLKCVKNQSEQYHYYMAVCEYKKGNHLASLEHLKNHKLMEKYKKVTDALKFLNDIELNEQLDIFENDLLHIIYSEPPSKELHLIYLKGAIHCYKNEWYVKGAEICQIACTVLRTPMILTLLAKCLIQISEFETAESALNEANVMDIKNEEVWAYLTVVNIKMGNVSEAKVCYIRALECGLQTEMKNEINKLFGKELDILI
ncbi:uncharacterized protein LOC114127870 isoform X6 [Aphis gossypii]|uniref:uncharacterized protein LOC114127870 isoform X6 n=1 Tax=Aphis gossypii TaxID=80765 RepID=UPI0021595510|nr:uncharacterized protein LOC114127870 isoform X6 [Aphis gossypii]